MLERRRRRIHKLTRRQMNALRQRAMEVYYRYKFGFDFGGTAHSKDRRGVG